MKFRCGTCIHIKTNAWVYPCNDCCDLMSKTPSHYEKNNPVQKASDQDMSTSDWPKVTSYDFVKPTEEL